MFIVLDFSFKNLEYFLSIIFLSLKSLPLTIISLITLFLFSSKTPGFNEIVISLLSSLPVTSISAFSGTNVNPSFFSLVVTVLPSINKLENAFWFFSALVTNSIVLLVLSSLNSNNFLVSLGDVIRVKISSFSVASSVLLFKIIPLNLLLFFSALDLILILFSWILISPSLPNTASIYNVSLSLLAFNSLLFTDNLVKAFWLTCALSSIPSNLVL